MMHSALKMGKSVKQKFGYELLDDYLPSAYFLLIFFQYSTSLLHIFCLPSVYLTPIIFHLPSAYNSPTFCLLCTYLLIIFHLPSAYNSPTFCLLYTYILSTLGLSSVNLSPNHSPKIDIAP